MTKTYELPNEKMIMADVDEKHHTATISVYALDDLVETVNETRRWIPVSERTPEHGGEYLLWGKICDCDEEDYCFLGDYYEFEEKFGIEESNYDPHTLGFLDTEIDEYYSVIAWMPLPKPYKVESEG